MPRGFGQTTAAMADPGSHGAFPSAVSAPRYAVLECEFDTGGRFTVWGSSDSHRPLPPIRRKATPCGSAAASAVANGRHGPWRERPPSPKARCGIGASVVSHARPRLQGVAPAASIRPGRVSSAASRRWRTRWPTGWPVGCAASPTETGTDPSRPAFAFLQGLLDRERPPGGWDGLVRPNPRRCPHWASKQGGRSRPRPGSPVRHRRIGRPWPN